MTQIRYSLFRRECLDNIDNLRNYEPWDVFVSAFNKEDRIHQVFNAVRATNKHYFSLPDYGMGTANFPQNVLPLEGGDENQVVEELVRATNLQPDSKVCVDATGIVRQYLPVLMKRLQTMGMVKFDFLYSEPARYDDKESTQFSSADLTEVRQVLGFEGSHKTDSSSDVLIIGAGYEHRLIAAVSDYKNRAEKKVIFAFPSMRADMYQESVLSTYISRESLGEEAVESPRFAPAYDPFVTAATLQSIVGEVEKNERGISNLYLAPVSSKPITIGFSLYYLLERMETATSIILPFTKSYSDRAAVGISRIWLYKIELDAKAEQSMNRP